MKTIVRTLLGVVVWALVWLSPSQAAQVFEQKLHRDWASLVLKEGNEAISKMVTQAADKASFLTLDFYPSNCDVGIARMSFPFDAATRDGAKGTLRGSLRIDTNTIVDVSFQVNAEDGAMVFNIDGIYGERLFKAALNGREIRFKINLPNSEPAYTRYSLMGFTAAYERAQNFCRLIRNHMDGSRDENYFPNSERPQRREAPRKRDDSAYF